MFAFYKQSGKSNKPVLTAVPHIVFGESDVLKYLLFYLLT